MVRGLSLFLVLAVLLIAVLVVLLVTAVLLIAVLVVLVFGIVVLHDSHLTAHSMPHRQYALFIGKIFSKGIHKCKILCYNDLNTHNILCRKG